MNGRSRERILERIRKAGGTAPKGRPQTSAARSTASFDQSRIIPVLEESCRDTGTALFLLDDPALLADALLDRAGRLGAESVLICTGDVPGGDGLRSRWSGTTRVGERVTVRFEPGEGEEDSNRHPGGMARTDACVTGCRALAAEGGVCLVDSAAGPGRLGSLLPPHHLVVARRSALSMSLDEAFERLGGMSGVSGGALILISGPSRTADIEKKLVIGVHGPVTLTLFLVP